MPRCVQVPGFGVCKIQNHPQSVPLQGQPEAGKATSILPTTGCVSNCAFSWPSSQTTWADLDTEMHKCLGMGRTASLSRAQSYRWGNASLKIHSKRKGVWSWYLMNWDAKIPWSIVPKTSLVKYKLKNEIFKYLKKLLEATPIQGSPQCRSFVIVLITNLWTQTWR